MIDRIVARLSPVELPQVTIMQVSIPNYSEGVFSRHLCHLSASKTESIGTNSHDEIVPISRHCNDRGCARCDADSGNLKGLRIMSRVSKTDQLTESTIAAG